jgi:hypothetical protein
MSGTLSFKYMKMEAWKINIAESEWMKRDKHYHTDKCKIMHVQ